MHTYSYNLQTTSLHTVVPGMQRINVIIHNNVNVQRCIMLPNVTVGKCWKMLENVRKQCDIKMWHFKNKQKVIQCCKMWKNVMFILQNCTFK